MSSIAEWANENVATVWPHLATDAFTRVTTYGEPYQIACTWAIGRGRQSRTGDVARRDLGGQEYVVTATFYTEDKRPKYRDRIASGTHTGSWEGADAREVREVLEDDASMFGEPDRPDMQVLV